MNKIVTIISILVGCSLAIYTDIDEPSGFLCIWHLITYPLVLGAVLFAIVGVIEQITGKSLIK